jgi:cbb3-type cytochrome oxidase cytochrome c subunit
MAFDLSKLTTLADAIATAEQTLSDATAANNAAQAAASAAAAQAATTTLAQQTAHQGLSDAVDALVAYANSLKS